jgi:hypothetical protein
MSSTSFESSPSAYAMAALTLSTAIAARLKAKGILLDSEIQETMNIGIALLEKMDLRNLEAKEVRRILEDVYSVFIAPTPPPRSH